MGRIDLRINKEGLEHNIAKAKENKIIIPTIEEMEHPEKIPEKIRENQRQFREFYREMGFSLVSEDAQGNTRWKLDLAGYEPKNEVIAIERRESV